MKSSSTIWRVVAAAAIMFSAGYGFAGSKSQMTPTHYNSAPAGSATPQWTPIPAGFEVSSCDDSPTRLCTGVEVSPNNIQPTSARGFANLTEI